MNIAALVTADASRTLPVERGLFAEAAPAKPAQQRSDDAGPPAPQEPQEHAGPAPWGLRLAWPEPDADASTAELSQLGGDADDVDRADYIERLVAEGPELDGVDLAQVFGRPIIAPPEVAGLIVDAPDEIVARIDRLEDRLEERA